MPKLNQRGPACRQAGIIHLLLPIILILGLIAGVYLVTSGDPLKFFSKASMSKPTGPETSFTLVGPNECAGISCIFPRPQEQFEVKLYARSDIETANLFTAKITFPKDLVEVVEIKEESAFVQNWVEDYYDNTTGEIDLTGGVAAPGYQTQQGGESALMATITFKAKTLGKGIVALTDSSAIYSNLNNINILTIKRNYDLSVEVKPAPTPISAPISKCTYGSTQARLQKDTSDPWANFKIINVGEKIRVGGFHNGTGLLASDAKLYIVGPKSCISDPNVCTQASVSPENGAFITPPGNGGSGTYTLTVTTQGQTGPACEDTASFEVQKCTSRPACLDARPACLMPEPADGWCPTPTGKGDGNKDGKINLIDMSIIHTDWRKTDNMTGFKESIDMNDDKVINTFDFGLHRNLLIKLGVIKVR